ncbi:DUF2726 domain-containing protein [Propionivibrio sp.]|uniref:DUF2726 domain-containing protein n=1 Tax=Propionivibrio sp. TaxID=2212460 RepID=UPI0039E37784
MKVVIFLIVLLLLVALISVFLKKKTASGRWPFYVKKILTQPEQVLFHRLVTALPDYVVLSQVQLSRVLGVEKGARFHEWNNRINRMSLDFLICRKNFSVVAAVELDDSSHLKESRIRADDKKNKALSDAGVKLVRFKVSDIPNETMIRESIFGPKPVQVEASVGAVG